MICRRFLDRNPEHTIDIDWSPGYEGIEENERADELTKAGGKVWCANETTTLTHARRVAKEKAPARWTEKWKKTYPTGSFAAADRIPPSWKPKLRLSDTKREVYGCAELVMHSLTRGRTDARAYLPLARLLSPPRLAWTLHHLSPPGTRIYLRASTESTCVVPSASTRAGVAQDECDGTSSARIFLQASGTSRPLFRRCFVSFRADGLRGMRVSDAYSTWPIAGSGSCGAAGASALLPRALVHPTSIFIPAYSPSPQTPPRASLSLPSPTISFLSVLHPPLSLALTSYYRSLMPTAAADLELHLHPATRTSFPVGPPHLLIATTCPA
ncbi:hypothetical protein B0H19DRAFT_1261927 [Mycena capillaripes]|nr:hypothetical protein B0H19DRAFT_1261927 [Mycena capillaripes]